MQDACLLLEEYRPGSILCLHIRDFSFSAPSLGCIHPCCLPRDSRGFTQSSVFSSSISGAGQ